jgi:protein phosphatase
VIICLVEPLPNSSSEEAETVPKLVLHCSAATHAGRVRSNNEDAIGVSGTSEFPLTSWTGALSATDGWTLVADGMGGHAAGEVASHLAVELLRPVLPSLQNDGDIMLALHAANDALFETMVRHPSFLGMGTTVVGALFRKDHALVFNVGDSRAYLHQDGALTKLTVDDVVGGNQLTQCLGGIDPQACIVPHVRLVPLSPGAQLLLCSDGLTDMLTDEQIAAKLGERGDMSVDALVSRALEAGGQDNLSTALITVTSA